jgi:hypothetical protein
VEDEAGRGFDKGLTPAEWLLLLMLAAVQFTHRMDFMIMMPLGPQGHVFGPKMQGLN